MRATFGRLLLLALCAVAGNAHAQSVRCIPGFGPPQPGDNCDGVQGDARNPLPDGYIALALSKNGTAGSGYGPDEATASRIAVAGCTRSGGDGCKVAQTYFNSCASMAGSKAEKVVAVSVLKGAGWNASGLALAKCRQSGGSSCQVLTTVCYNGYVSPTAYAGPVPGAPKYEAPVLRRR